MKNDLLVVLYIILLLWALFLELCMVLVLVSAQKNAEHLIIDGG